MGRREGGSSPSHLTANFHKCPLAVSWPFLTNVLLPKGTCHILTYSPVLSQTTLFQASLVPHLSLASPVSQSPQPAQPTQLTKILINGADSNSAPNSIVGGFFPHRHATGRHQLGIPQLNWILTLSTQRQHQTPQVKGSALQDSPLPLQMPASKFRWSPVLLSTWL